MPRVTRRQVVEADAAALWSLVSDPRALPRWWPGVERVEEPTAEAWTKVLRSSKGKTLRADFTRTEADAPRFLAWRQEVDETPFERFLAEATVRIRLSPAGESEGTRVELVAVRRLRGLARLGWPMVRRATARQLDDALRGLAEAVIEAPRRPASGRGASSGRTG